MYLPCLLNKEEIAMTPYAIFQYYWAEAGDDYFNVCYPGHWLDGSTVSRKTCQLNGIKMIESDADAQEMIKGDNMAFATLRGLL